MNPGDVLLEAIAQTERWARLMESGELELNPEYGSAWWSEADAGERDWYAGLWPKVVHALGASSYARKVYVTTEMCQLLEVAQATFPDTKLTHDLLPWPAGFVVFQKPLPMPAIQGYVLERHGPNLDAVGWYFVRPGTDSMESATRPPEEGEQDAVVCVCGFQRDRMDDSMGWVPTLTALWNENDMMSEIADSLTQDSGADNFLRTMFALWVLMVQRVAVQDTASGSRPFRRRFQREHPELDLPTTSVVRLRRPTSTSHDDPDDAEHHGVNWTHRWMVDGFWRQQHHGPRNSLTKTVYIAPHVKGPEHLPFVAKERTYKWER